MYNRSITIREPLGELANNDQHGRQPAHGHGEPFPVEHAPLKWQRTLTGVHQRRGGESLVLPLWELGIRCHLQTRPDWTGQATFLHLSRMQALLGC